MWPERSEEYIILLEGGGGGSGGGGEGAGPVWPTGTVTCIAVTRSSLPALHNTGVSQLFLVARPDNTHMAAADRSRKIFQK